MNTQEISQAKTFDCLSLHPSILKAVSQEGYKNPTPIQERTIPSVLEGKDVIATAQTGTGKTAAFCLPILQILSDKKVEGGNIRALILTPTRELAAQIQSNIRTYGRHLRLRSAVVVGGMPMGPQLRDLRDRPEILVATPGRLIDLIEQRRVFLDKAEILVLDEADRMLDMGFAPAVERIVRLLSKNRQTLMFSATMSNEVLRLADKMLSNPVRVSISPSTIVAQRIDQKVMFVNQNDKNSLLTEVIRKRESEKILVFTRTKRRADRVARQLCLDGITADAIHADKTQGARKRILSDFGRGRVNVLVATDVLARGIDVSDISCVINYELPDDAENYVHRIGRTGRAQASGVALSFCDFEELSALRGIESLVKNQLETVDDHSFHAEQIAANREQRSRSPRGRSGGGRRGGSRGGSWSFRGSRGRSR